MDHSRRITKRHWAPDRRSKVRLSFWLNPEVLATVRKTDLDKRLGRERMLFNARDAIQHYQALRAAEAASPTVS